MKVEIDGKFPSLIGRSKSTAFGFSYSVPVEFPSLIGRSKSGSLNGSPRDRERFHP